jgi:NAD(P)-dependent dehydrogenase (short-subunit alcohol dehydrogenase family)
MAISFEGRVAIVTGAGGGIGRAHAQCLTVPPSPGDELVQVLSQTGRVQ